MSSTQPDLLTPRGVGLGYHNTTQLRGSNLILAIESAAKQDVAILTIFRSQPRRKLSPSDIWTLCDAAYKPWPLTSIRRAMSDLTRAKHLVMTGDQKIGIYGRPENYWRLA